MWNKQKMYKQNEKGELVEREETFKEKMERLENHAHYLFWGD